MGKLNFQIKGFFIPDEKQKWCKCPDDADDVPWYEDPLTTLSREYVISTSEDYAIGDALMLQCEKCGMTSPLKDREAAERLWGFLTVKEAFLKYYLDNL